LRRCDPGALALGRVHVIFAALETKSQRSTGAHSVLIAKWARSTSTRPSSDSASKTSPQFGHAIWTRVAAHLPVLQPAHRSSSGTPRSAESMWAPQPAQVNLPQLLHGVFQHILGPRTLLSRPERAAAASGGLSEWTVELESISNLRSARGVCTPPTQFRGSAAPRKQARRTMSEATGDWGSGAPPPEQPPPALPPVPPALPPLPPPSPAPPGGWPTPPPPSYPPAPPLEMTVTAIVGGSAMLPVVAVTLYALIMLVLRRKPWLFTLCDCSSCCSKRRPTLQVPTTQPQPAQLSPRLNASI
jgi:hypothetical protein